MKVFLNKSLIRLQKANLISISIGIVYLWFGLLKFFPSMSPAEELAINTIDKLTFDLIPSNISIILLAIWETSVGLLLILGFYRKTAIVSALIHMIFTFTPLILFPEISFNSLPFSFTIIGQYIVKNIIIVSALLFLLREHKINQIVKGH